MSFILLNQTQESVSLASEIQEPIALPITSLRSEFAKDKIAALLLESVEKNLSDKSITIVPVSDTDPIHYNSTIEAWSDIVTKQIFIRDSLSLPKKLTGLLWELINLSMTKKQEKNILNQRHRLTPALWAQFCLTTEFQTAQMFDKILKNIRAWPIHNKEDFYYNYTDRNVFFKDQHAAYGYYKKDQEEFLKEHEDSQLIESVKSSKCHEALTAYVMPFQSPALPSIPETFNSSSDVDSHTTQPVKSLIPSTNSKKSKRKYHDQTSDQSQSKSSKKPKDPITLS